MNKRKRKWLIAGGVLTVILAGLWSVRGSVIFWVLDRLAPVPAEWVYPGARVQRHIRRSGESLWDDGSEEYLRLKCPANVATAMAWYRGQMNGEEYTERGSVTGPRDVVPDEALRARSTFAGEILRHPGQPHSEIDASVEDAMGVTVWGHPAGDGSIIEVVVYYNGR